MAGPTNPVPQMPSATDRAIRQMETEKKQEKTDKFTGWVFIWTLFAFKIATVIIIIIAASGTAEAWSVVIFTGWAWLGIPVVACSGFVTWRWRLFKARRKRAQLQHQEFETSVLGWSDHHLSEEDRRRLEELKRRRRDNA